MLGASVVRGDYNSDAKALTAKVGPAIVQVVHEDSHGSGFVLDAEKGIIATSYRAIEGAREITITFPADSTRKDHPGDGGFTILSGKTFPADGYFAILPGKDLALIHVNFGDRKITVLKLVEKIPEIGDTIWTYGSPLGEPMMAAGTVQRHA